MDEGNRIRDPGHTRALVIDAAERLFAERGFAATSMRDISAASGVSHPLIHHHFGSKEELYAAVKRRMVEGYARRFPAAARAPNRPLSVRSEMRRIMTYLSENPVMLRLCSWTRLEGDVQVWPGEPDLLDTLRRRVEAAQRRGQVRSDLDPAVLSLMIFGLIIFWVENRAHFAERFRGRIVDEAYLRQAVALIELGIAPSPGGTKAARRTAGSETLGDGQ
jgi:TetR/AcrR family transcriptional regulator